MEKEGEEADKENQRTEGYAMNLVENKRKGELSATKEHISKSNKEKISNQNPYQKRKRNKNNR